MHLAGISLSFSFILSYFRFLVFFLFFFLSFSLSFFLFSLAFSSPLFFLFLLTLSSFSTLAFFPPLAKKGHKNQGRGRDKGDSCACARNIAPICARERHDPSLAHAHARAPRESVSRPGTGGENARQAERAPCRARPRQPARTCANLENGAGVSALILIITGQRGEAKMPRETHHRVEGETHSYQNKSYHSKNHRAPWL